MSTVKIDNKKLHDWIVEKDALVTEGRKISADLDKIEIKIKRFETLEKRITTKIEPKELTEKGEAIIKQMEALNKEVVEIGKKISAEKLAAIPAQMKADHEALMKERAEKEQARNKIALKVQKIKDRIIPLVQKEVKPLLEEYDDIETAKVKDGQVVIETFNHLAEFKARFKK